MGYANIPICAEIQNGYATYTNKQYGCSAWPQQHVSISSMRFEREIRFVGAAQILIVFKSITDAPVL